MPKKQLKHIVILVVVLSILISGIILFFILKNDLTDVPEQIDKAQVVEIPKIEVELPIGKIANISELDKNKLIKDGHYYTYEDDNYKTLIGLDVSEFNQDINFDKLKDNGIDFVIIRVGWRGYSEGIVHEDKYFEQYYQGAKEAGLLVGFYFFSQAVDDLEAIQEAEFTLNLIKDKECDLFVVFDMESAGKQEGRIYYSTREQLTECARRFCSMMDENGYKPMIYVNDDWARNYYFMTQLKDFPVWFAYYDDIVDTHFDFQLWQYSASATIPGSKLVGSSDMNIMIIENE